MDKKGYIWVTEHVFRRLVSGVNIYNENEELVGHLITDPLLVEFTWVAAISDGKQAKLVTHHWDNLYIAVELA